MTNLEVMLVCMFTYMLFESYITTKKLDTIGKAITDLQTSYMQLLDRLSKQELED